MALQKSSFRDFPGTTERGILSKAQRRLSELHLQGVSKDSPELKPWLLCVEVLGSQSDGGRRRPATPHQLQDRCQSQNSAYLPTLHHLGLGRGSCKAGRCPLPSHTCHPTPIPMPVHHARSITRRPIPTRPGRGGSSTAQRKAPLAGGTFLPLIFFVTLFLQDSLSPANGPSSSPCLLTTQSNPPTRAMTLGSEPSSPAHLTFL